MIAVVGAGGMLGQALVAHCKSLNLEVSAYTKEQLNICSEISLLRFFRSRNRPKLIINCAAMTNVDACEKSPNEAYRLNALGPEILADLSRQYQSRMFHISTDYVFDGRAKQPYSESDETNPIQVYGTSKRDGERAVVGHGGVVLRVQWLYGHGKPNFASWVLGAALKGERISVSSDQFGCPTSTPWLAAQISLIASKLTTPGIYHVSHDDFCTRLDFASHLVQLIGKNPDDILQPVQGTDFGVAKRPAYTPLSNSKIIDVIGLRSMGSWKTDASEYLKAVWSLPLRLK